VEHYQFCEIPYNSSWPAVRGIWAQDLWGTSTCLYQYATEIYLSL